MKTATLAAAQSLDSAALVTHARILSADTLAGRLAGSSGERRAAEYIAAALRDHDVDPIQPGGSHLQPFGLLALPVDSARSVLRFASPASTREVRPPHFYHVAGAERAFAPFSGPLLLAGRLDDLADAAGLPDLAGRVVVASAHAGAQMPRVIRNLEERAAAALLVVIPDSVRFDRLRNARGPIRFALDCSIDDPFNQPRIPVLALSPAGFAALGEVAGRPTASAGAPGAVPATVTVTGSFQVGRVPQRSQNVVGIVRGTDPRLRDEYVVFVAHYDHIGIAAAEDGDSVYNGFTDNAIGVGAVLGISRVIAGRPLPRSAIFLFTGAEEQGLLGASAFLADSLVPPASIAGVVNLDAGAPPAVATSWYLAGGDRSGIGALAEAVVRAHGYRTEVGPAFPDSDHWAFLEHGIPAVFPVPSGEWRDLTAEEGERLLTRWARAHRPDDEWSPDFPLAGVAAYAELALAIGRAIGSAPAPLRR